jgi:hypothetical protein
MVRGDGMDNIPADLGLHPVLLQVRRLARERDIDIDDMSEVAKLLRELDPSMPVEPEAVFLVAAVMDVLGHHDRQIGGGNAWNPRSTKGSSDTTDVIV